jgi:hypothetical protein
MRSAARLIGGGLLALGLAGCQSAKPIEKPLFVGPPDLAHVQAAALADLGAPVPAFKQIKLLVHAPGDGHIMGTSVETLKAATGGAGRYVEEAIYHVLGGKCTVNNRTDAVGVGGFVVLQELAESWSPDCEGWGTGYGRREVSAITQSGRLFPLKVGNRLTLRYTVIGTDRGRDEGVADYEEVAEESYEVIERQPDYRLENGRNLGEVFAIRATSVKAGKRRTYTFLFSTMLGWRVGYTTDVRVVLVDWAR